MTKIDLTGRTPTVQRAPAFPWPRWRLTPLRPQRKLARDPRSASGEPDAATTAPTPPSASRTRPSVPNAQPSSAPPNPAPAPRTTRRIGSLGLIMRESIALFGMAGAVLTVFSQLAAITPLSRPYMDVLGWWMTVSSNFWLSYYDQIGFYPHSHLQAALALAAFLALIGLGARVAAIVSGPPLERRWGFLDGMTWPSLAIMATFAVIFLLGHDPNASSITYDTTSKETIKYLFAIILTVGYAAGDFLGQRGFHQRLYRLAVLLIMAVAFNHWLLSSR